MSTALALIQPNEFDMMSKLAQIAAKSGYVGKTPEQCLFIMIKGLELGISSMQALDGIQIINGKATVSPQLMLALINRSGEIEDLVIDGSAQKCVVTMKRKGRTAHTETFTIQDAQTMGLAGKDNWKKQPAVMLKWRAVAACARVVFPDVIQGMYTPEELGAETSENDAGDLVIIEPEKKPEALTLPAVVPSNVDVVTGEIVEPESEAPAQPKAQKTAPPQQATVSSLDAIEWTPKDVSTGMTTVPPTSFLHKSNIGKLKAKVQQFYQKDGTLDTFHLNGSIAKMLNEGYLIVTMTVDDAEAKVIERKAEPLPATGTENNVPF
jgi:hypothetical protein